MTATILHATFSTASAVDLSSLPPEVGGAWSLWNGSHIPRADPSGVLRRNPAASTTWAFAINETAHTYDNERVAFVVERIDSFTSWAVVGCRASGVDSTSTGYWCRVSETSVELWRTVNNSSSSLGSAAISATTTGSYNFELRVSNSVDLATVTLELWMGGALVITRTDTSALRITARGRIVAGLYNGIGFGLSSITATNDDPPATDTITITYPTGTRAPQARNRGAMTGSLRVVGTYTGAPTSLQARVVQAGTNTPLPGLDWATYVTSPSPGSFDFNIPGVPVALAWYEIQVRFGNATGVTATSGQTHPAEMVLVVGQSNARFAFDVTGSTSLTPNTFCSVFGFGAGAGTAWQALDPVKMHGPIDFCADFVAAGIPVAFVSTAVGGTSITSWNPGGAQYVNAMNMVVGAANGKITTIVNIQGEVDVDAMSAATYLAELGDEFDTGFRVALADAGLPVVDVQLGYQNVAGNTDAGMEQIRAAKAAWCAAAPTKNLRVERYDLTFDSGHCSDTVHLNAAGHRVLWPRIARAARFGTGAVATYRGPRIVAVSQVNATTLDVMLSLDFGADIVAGDTAPWRVTDGGTPIAVTGVSRQSASVARLVLAASAAAPVVGYAYGKVVAGAPLRDNSALALPLEWSEGVAASAQVTGDLHLDPALSGGSMESEPAAPVLTGGPVLDPALPGGSLGPDPGGSVLAGDGALDPALPGGSLGSDPGGSVLSGDGALDPVGVGGGLTGVVVSELGGGVPLGPIELGGGMSGDTSGVLPPLTPGRRVIYAGRQVPQKLAALDVAEVDNLTADFSTVFPSTEPVIQTDVVCEARVGTDARPVPLLVGDEQIQGQMVRQRISGALGEVGVTYLVRVTALAASGRWAVAAGFVKVTRMG